MAKTPNYSFERKERDRQKAAKKADKLAAKTAERERTKGEQDENVLSPEDDQAR